MSTSTTMGHTKTTYHHGDLRNALVDSACRLVQDGGADSFSLREVARSLGVSANAAYRHFADKSALIMAVAAEGFGQLAQSMQRAQATTVKAIGAEKAAVTRFKAMGRAYVEFAMRNPGLFRVMFGCCLAGDAELAPRPSPYELLGAALDDLVKAGILPPHQRVGAELKVWTVVHGFASLVLEGGDAFRPKSERSSSLESLLDFAVAGLCAPTTAPVTRGAKP